MNDEGTRSVRLLRIDVRLELDLVLARQRVRQISAALGFEPAAQTRITTALSEIVRNAYQYAGGSSVEFAVETYTRVARGGAPARQALVIKVEDRGPGMPPVDDHGRVLSSGGGLGLGMGGARRLMDRFVVQSSSAGTTVTMAKVMPPGTELKRPERLQSLVDDLVRQPAASPVEEIQLQNQELLRTLNELRAREQELTRVNQELTETNSGVLALYDELETLHRVGLMLAERHNLHDLLQTIIDATTDLTGAELGAFYYHEVSGETWRLNAISGKRRDILSKLPLDNPPGLFGLDIREHSAVRIDDVYGEGAAAVSHWTGLIAESYPVRSCLIVPVLMANSELAGALAFSHSAEGAFTERSERIVSAIAVQAAVGIEKARLFHGLQTASEAKDRFLAMLSHELRTPLNPVLAILSSLAMDKDVPEHLHEDVIVMRRNIELEARLIDDLLDFNRIARGKLELDRTIVDMHSLIEAVVEICRPEINQRRQELRLELDAPQAHVAGDTARLQQVLWNILKNAVKFTAAGGQITVRTAIDDEADRLLIHICDDGAGIDPKMLPIIFSAFDQGALSPGRHGGLGLGLAIAKTFMDLHGGRISAASDGLGKGAVFTLDMPLMAQPHVSSPNRKDVEPRGDGHAASLRILLVDDHADTLNTLARLLSRRGHVVATAASCADALALAARDRFELLISDIGLPDRSGLELVAELHQLQQVPAIALSGYGMEADLANSRSAGFSRHVTKPVNFAALEETIREIFGDKKKGDEAA
jgi:signal transduction histidine kinase/ActR/RegA family two-component response regulator